MTTQRAHAIQSALLKRYTHNSLLMVWPSWLTREILLSLESLGLARHEHGGPSTFADTFWFMVTP
jgi:hypothetical protein